MLSRSWCRASKASLPLVMPAENGDLCAAVNHVAAGASHRSWTLRVDNQAHHHGVVQLGESPLYLELSWRATKSAPVQRVGLFRLDLHGLLQNGHIRRERGTGSGVRLRIVRDEHGHFCVQVNEDGPRLRMDDDQDEEEPPAVLTPAKPGKPPVLKLTGRQVERIALPHLEVSVLRAGLQLATPTIDSGIDAVVFATEGGFRARPVQLKAFSGRGWSLYQRYEKFDQLLMAYVWSAVSADAQVVVMTYAESFAIAKAMGFTETASWKTGVKTGKPGYAVTTMTVGGKLHQLCIPHLATPERWQALLATKG